MVPLLVFELSEKEIALPWHPDAPPNKAAGLGFTVTWATAVPLHVPETPVTVYDADVNGEALAVFAPVDVAPADQL